MYAIDLRKKFAGIQKEHSIQSRPFYCHFTSVTETKSTKHILSNGTFFFSICDYCLLISPRFSARHDSSRESEEEQLDGRRLNDHLQGYVLDACSTDGLEHQFLIHQHV